VSSETDEQSTRLSPSAPAEEPELPGLARQMHKGEVKKASWLQIETLVILIKCYFIEVFL